MSTKATKLKIKTSFNDDLRLLKVDYKDVNEVYEKVKAFIAESYQIKNVNKFMMQYKDDEEDLLTIVSKEDLEDAIQESIEAKKSLKIFVSKKKNKQAKKAKQQPKSKPVQVQPAKNPEEAEEEKKEEPKPAPNKAAPKKEEANVAPKKEENELTGNIHEDMVNNIKFRKEMISFLSTVILIYQQNKEVNNNNNNELDLKSCIATALSTHGQVANHKDIKEKILPQLNIFIGQIEPMAKQFLFAFDASKIEEIVNNACQQKKIGNLENICGNLFGQQQAKLGINCPGNHGLKQFAANCDDYSCNVCNRKITKEEQVFGCRLCNWDCCDTCKQAEEPSFHRQQSPFMFGAYGRGCGFGRGGRRHGRGGHYKHHKHHGHGHKRRHNNNNNNNNAVEYRADIIDNPLPRVQQDVIDGNEKITKEWKIKNVGSCSLPPGLYVQYSGRKNNPMVTTKEFSIGNTQEIASGQEFIVRVSITTPNKYGSFSSNWRLTTPNGQKFGQKLAFRLVLQPNKPQKQEEKKEEIIEQPIEQEKPIEQEQEQEQDTGVDMILNNSDEDEDEDEDAGFEVIQKKEDEQKKILIHQLKQNKNKNKKKQYINMKKNLVN